MKRTISLIATLLLFSTAWAQKVVDENYEFSKDDISTEYVYIRKMVVDTSKIISVVTEYRKNKREELNHLYNEYWAENKELEPVLAVGENGRFHMTSLYYQKYQKLFHGLVNQSEEAQLFLNSSYVTEPGTNQKDNTTWLQRYKKEKKNAEKLMTKSYRMSPVIYEYIKWLSDYYQAKEIECKTSIENLDKNSEYQDYITVTGESELPQKQTSVRLYNPHYVDPLLQAYTQEAQEQKAIKSEPKTQESISSGHVPQEFNASNFKPQLNSLQDPFNIDRLFLVLQNDPSASEKQSFCLKGWFYQGSDYKIKPMYRNGEIIYINGLRDYDSRGKNLDYFGIAIHHNTKSVDCRKNLYLRSKTEYTIADYILTQEQLDMFMAQIKEYTINGSSATVASSYRIKISPFRDELEAENTFYTQTEPEFKHVLHLIPKDSSNDEFLVFGETIHGTYEYLMMDWWDKCCAPLIGKQVAIEGSYSTNKGDNSITHPYKDYVSKQVILLKNNEDFIYTIKEMYYDYKSTKGDVIIVIADKDGNTFSIYDRPTKLSSYSFLYSLIHKHAPKYRDFWGTGLCFFNFSDKAPLIIPKLSFDTLYAYTNKVEAERDRSEAQRKAAEDQEKVKIKNELSKIYGAQNAALIADGIVQIGMTQEMCKAAWGTPLYKKDVTTRLGTVTTWYYGPKTYLQFYDGKLEVISN